MYQRLFQYVQIQNRKMKITNPFIPERINSEYKYLTTRFKPDDKDDSMFLSIALDIYEQCRTSNNIELPEISDISVQEFINRISIKCDKAVHNKKLSAGFNRDLYTELGNSYCTIRYMYRQGYNLWNESL